MNHQRISTFQFCSPVLLGTDKIKAIENELDSPALNNIDIMAGTNDIGIIVCEPIEVFLMSFIYCAI